MASGAALRGASSIPWQRNRIGSATRDQSPIRRRSSHWRNSPFKPTLSATLECRDHATARSACHPLLALSQTSRCFLGDRQAFLPKRPSPVHSPHPYCAGGFQRPKYVSSTCERSSKPPTSHWRLSPRRNPFGSACAGFPRTSHIVTVHTRRSPMKRMARPTSMTLRGIAEK